MFAFANTGSYFKVTETMRNIGIVPCIPHILQGGMAIYIETVAPKASVQCTAPNSVLAILAKRLWLISVSPPDWANAPVVTPEASKSSSLMLFIIICHLFFSL